MYVEAPFVTNQRSTNVPSPTASPTLTLPHNNQIREAASELPAQLQHMYDTETFRKGHECASDCFQREHRRV